MSANRQFIAETSDASKAARVLETAGEELAQPYRPRRALREDAEAPVSHLHAAPRRALLERPNRTLASPPTLSAEKLRNLERARRGAPMRAMLDRLVDGFDGRARRALLNPDEALAAELIRLTQLDPRWGFLQSVHSSGQRAELEHWVIGPGGVYLLNAKHHPGSRLYVAGDNFLVDGKDAPYVPQIRDEAGRGSESLTRSTTFDLEVMGVIVPINDRKLTVDEQPYAVEVLEHASVAEWLLNRPEDLGAWQIRDAFEAARQSHSWRPGV